MFGHVCVTFVPTLVFVHAFVLFQARSRKLRNSGRRTISDTFQQQQQHPIVIKRADLQRMIVREIDRTSWHVWFYVWTREAPTNRLTFQNLQESRKLFVNVK